MAWVFWINVPVGGLAALLLAVIAVPHIEPAGKKRFDVVGAVLLTAVLVSVVLAVAWFSSGNSAAWIALGAGGVAALGGLVVVERGRQNPIIPVHLFRNRTFSAGVGLSAVMGAGLISATAYLPTHFQMAYGVSATISGWYPSPQCWECWWAIS